MAARSRVELGDWQTPAALAEATLTVAMAATRDADPDRGKAPPASVLEPTCGEGAFLVAAARAFPEAVLVGHEIDADHAATARRHLGFAGARAHVEVHDFFRVDWAKTVAALPEPILVIGNPPWVTNAGLGALDSTNLPPKENFKGLSGLEALTGKSNFDVSEWMILRLLEALVGRRARLAVLCKSIVARRIIEIIAQRGIDVQPGGLFRIDAMEHFGAAVDAVLFVCETGDTEAARTGGARIAARRWPVHASLKAREPSSWLAVEGGVLVADAARFERTRHLAGTCNPVWRSGIKHDCARVMDLRWVEGSWQNGLDERVDVEDELVFPMLKSSDVANGRTPEAREGGRAMIVPQQSLGEDTRGLETRAPRLWRYLTRHRELLAARRSSIYRAQPPFAVFGVGPYAFAPWKVAIAGLYKRSVFTLVGPAAGRPVVLDDTCYFLGYDEEGAARRALAALRSPPAQDFILGRVFWDAKRPITKALLQSLDLRRCGADRA